MKKLNKMLAILMAALTCASTMNVAVFADTEEVMPEEQAAVEETVDIEEEAAPEDVAPAEDNVIIAQEGEEVVPDPTGMDTQMPDNVDPLIVDGFQLFFADTGTSELSIPYTGVKQQPSIMVYDSEGKMLIPGTDFKKTYTDNLNAGTGYIYIKGLSDKAITEDGSFLNAQIKFTITPITIPSTIKLSASSYPYAAGKAVSPSVTVTDANGKALVKGTDYTLKYSNNKNIGTGKVVIAGKGNFKGTRTKSFKIVKCSASKLTYKLSKTKYTYNGKKCKPSVTVYNGKTKLSKKKYKVTYSSNVKPGTAKVKVTLTDKKHYTGSKTVSYTIAPSKPVISKIAKADAGVTITWKKVTGVDGYYLYKKAGNGSYKQIKKTTALSYKDTAAKIGGSYTYYVVAYKGSIKSAKSTAKSVTVKLPTPQILKAEPAKGGGIRLQTKLSGAQRYEVYRCEDGVWSYMDGTSDAKVLTDWTDKTAKKGKTYDYQIIAWALKNSKTGKYDAKAYSNIVRATCTKVADVAGFGSSEDAEIAPSIGGLRIMWDEVDGIAPTFKVKDLSGEVETGSAGYEVQFSLAEDFDGAVIVKVTAPDSVTGRMNSCVIDPKYIPADATKGYARIRTFQTIDGTTSRSDWGPIQEYDL